MLNSIKHIFTVRAMLRRVQTEQAVLEAWSLQFGREAAALWVQALSTRDAGRLSNA